jgi:hypothetical protein
MEMNKAQVAGQLASLHMRVYSWVKAVERKKSWRPSEKAMAIADYRQAQRALEIAYELLQGRPMKTVLMAKHAEPYIEFTPTE